MHKSTVLPSITPALPIVNMSCQIGLFGGKSGANGFFLTDELTNRPGKFRIITSGYWKTHRAVG